MARIGDVWDSTTDAARGRAGVIAPLALAAFYLPGVVQAAVSAYGDPTSTTVMVVTGLLVLVTLVAAIWGQLAVIAVATDPATTRADAVAQANRRLPPALAVALVLLLIAIVALLPAIIALAAAGIDWQAIASQPPGTPPAISRGQAGSVVFAFLWFLAFIPFALWLGARVLLAYAAVLNERLGVGAIRRSIALTRGMTWKLIGVLLLYAVVVGVATLAAQGIPTLVVRLLLGEAHQATAVFVGALFGGLASTALVALFCVFVARLYVATAGAPPAEVAAVFE